MSRATYIRLELLRAARNRRFFVFSLGFPLVLYLLIAAPNRHVADLSHSGISAPLYFMVSLVTLGTMNAVVAGGGRIAVDRTIGWQRQLRLTPLKPATYLGSKLLIGYLSALLTVVVLYGTGVSLGVRMPAGDWLGMTAMILVGLLPFAALGIALGHLISVDALGPAIGGLTGVLAFLGGVWFPLDPGFLHDVAQGLPSYWLVQASRIPLGASWSMTGWLVIVGWTALLGAVAAFAYRHDTKRAGAGAGRLGQYLQHALAHRLGPGSRAVDRPARAARGRCARAAVLGRPAG
jgi:ABC-2 type transport system permease protein